MVHAAVFGPFGPLRLLGGTGLVGRGVVGRCFTCRRFARLYGLLAPPCLAVLSHLLGRLLVLRLSTRVTGLIAVGRGQFLTIWQEQGCGQSFADHAALGATRYFILHESSFG